MLAPFLHENFIEAGLDEAGRGCYAGPVFAAAVILPKDFYHPLLNDSKQLNEKQRDLLRPVIEKESIAFAVASFSSALGPQAVNANIPAISAIPNTFFMVMLSLYMNAKVQCFFKHCTFAV